MKKTIMLLVLLCCLCFGASAMQGEFIYQEETELAWGELRWFNDEQLEQIAPEGRTAWQSTNEKAASVDRWGNVQAAKPDSLQTTFIIAERGDVTYTWKVTVRPLSKEIVLYSGDEPLDQALLNLSAGQTQLPVRAVVLPEGASQNVSLSVQGNGASLDENNILHISQGGKFTVQAKAQDKGRASAEATVRAVFPVQEVLVSGPLQLTGGQSAPLSAQIIPGDATVQEVLWSSSDESVATVDKNGILTAQHTDSVQTVIITATAADGFGALCEFPVTIVPGAQRIEISVNGETFHPQSLILDGAFIGTVFELSANVEPAQALQDVVWSTSNKAIVKVAEDGRIGIVGRGECRVTAQAADGSGTKRVLHIAVGNMDEKPYYLEVDKGNQVVRVYEKDENGLYTKLIRRMVCSTGINDNGVKNALYTVDSTRLKWMSTVVPGVYCQYGTRFVDHIWFHSLPYQSTNPARMDAEAYGQLGTRASHGCIRLLAADAKWIYENVPGGCWLLVWKCERTEEEYAAVSWPEAPGTWDPTDENPENPAFVPGYTSAVDPG